MDLVEVSGTAIMFCRDLLLVELCGLSFNGRCKGCKEGAFLLLEEERSLCCEVGPLKC